MVGKSSKEMMATMMATQPGPGSSSNGNNMPNNLLK